VERHFQKAEAGLRESFTKQFKPTCGWKSGSKLPKYAGRRFYKVTGESCLIRGRFLVGPHSVLTDFRDSIFNANSVLHISRKTNTGFLDLIFIIQEYIYR
jgi:hypothetical protein